MRTFLITLLFIPMAVGAQAEAQDTRVLPLQEFIQLATHKDTEFQQILIDELPLQYRKDLNLPAKDLVLDATYQYDLFLGDDREEPEASIGLSKLFPLLGTEIEVEYSTNPTSTRPTNSSDFTFMITQPIAENAFGKATRLQDKIIGVEIDVIKYQIAEAYEDYFATIITAYFNWYEAYENLKIGESSHQENLKLMENIKERQKSSIALQIDVNKITLQVLAKEETLIELREEYQNALNVVKKSIRYESEEVLAPQLPEQYMSALMNFEKDYQIFKDHSRTYQILNLLEDKSSLAVDKDANELLPSIDLLIGYEVSGQDLEITDEENMFFAGVTMEWPFGNQVDRAAYETSKIELEKTKLSTQSTHYRLYTDIKNLSLQVDREKKLLDIAYKKIELAEFVLEDETENYSYGKVTINDYIQSVNTLDNNQFNKVRHEALKAKLIVEWLRLTDQLVNRPEKI